MILDLVRGELFEASWSALAWEGRFLMMGFASGQIPQINLAQILLKNGAIIGEDLAAYITRDMQPVQEALTELLSWYEAGRLTPQQPRVYSLEEGGSILQRVADHQMREKIVLTTRNWQEHPSTRKKEHSA